MGLRRPFRKLARKLTDVYCTSIRDPAPGTVAWLVQTEQAYGGRVVATRGPSTLSDRVPDEIRGKLLDEGLVGGDRMSSHGGHGYAGWYAKHLAPWVRSGAPVTLLEVGVFKGTGLAIWCDLFPNGRVIGLDIELGNFVDNRGNLQALGAFRKAEPELHQFDQLADGNRQRLQGILGDDRLDIVTDDGDHSEWAIISTLHCVVPFLADPFVYFVEDKRRLYKRIARLFPQFRVRYANALTVISSS